MKSLLLRENWIWVLSRHHFHDASVIHCPWQSLLSQMLLKFNEVFHCRFLLHRFTHHHLILVPGNIKILIPVYMVLVALTGFLLPPGFARSQLTDPFIYAKGDNELYKIIIACYKTFTQLALLLTFLLVGWLMELCKDMIK